ncbi:MAG: hypothetical protein ACRDH5_13705, partial [bacterium]
MIGSPGRGVALLLCLVATAGVPSVADAQIGDRVKKALAGKATDEVKGGSCFADRRPTVVPSLPLSAAEIARVSAGLDAELAAAPEIEKKAADDQKKADAEQTAYEKAKAEYDKAYEKYSKCRDKVETADRGTSEAMNAKSNKATDQLGGGIDTTRLMALAEKAQAASRRVSEGKGTAEDRKTLAEFQAAMAPIQAQGMAAGASMQEASAFDQGAAARIEKACGKEPQPPKEPGFATSPEKALLDAGAKGARMDPQDYIVARELVIQWASSNTV